ncbi:hypothetical protein LTR85_009143 [Meristemomyces frigidus]|nr:hypothetical protein LTR85_009143 [Meristemomyces frigidus]
MYVGVLDLSNPVTKVLKINIDAGSYKLHWRFQFFDTSWSNGDMTFTEGPNQNGQPQYEYRGNPMNFPVWHRVAGKGVLQHAMHDTPSRPALCLSAGYSKTVLPINFANLNYETGHDLLAHQVLLPAETMPGRPNPPQASTRVDYWLRQEEYFRRMHEGWIVLSPDMLFEVVKGRPPTFMVCAIDSGIWLGGFRFAGVHLERVGP